MTEFSRLLVSSESPTTRALLRSGLADAPRAESFARVAAALGVSAGVVAVAAPASAFVNGAVGGSTLAAGGKASGTSALVLGKWLLSGLVGGALVSGTAGVVTNARARAAAEMSPPVASSAVVVTQPRTGSPHRASVPATPSLLEPASSEAGSVSTPGLPSPPNASLSPTPSASGALGAEAQRIDAVRRALGRGDIQRALIELDWYDRSRVVGVLDREAELLRIEALVRAGERERAVELGRAYLARHPHDAYASRLTELVASRGAHFPVGSGIDR